MPVTDRRPLTRQRVADAALDLIDEAGLEALSMRKLGAALGVEAMSLYNHVANKADLLRAVRATLFAEVLEAYGRPEGDWKTIARALSHAYVDVAARHPRAVLLLIESPADSEAELEFFGRIMAASRLVTDDLHAAALAFSVVGDWVVGSLVRRYGLLDQGRDGSDPRAEPLARHHAEALRFWNETGQLNESERFDEGLELILAGVEARFFPS
jgi:AcrR family transcriptional regulator